MSNIKCALFGISYGFHDSAAALVGHDGRIHFASSEERFTRIKGDRSWPQNAINNIIEYAEHNSIQVSGLCYYEDPLKRLSWSIRNSIASSTTLKEKLKRILKFSQNYINTTNQLLSFVESLSLSPSQLYISDHHISHAASALAFSPKQSGLVLILDAFGQDKSGFIGSFANNGTLSILKSFSVCQSVGLFYSAITSICGFKILSGEYKLMGLAPYGKPHFYEKLKEIFGQPTNTDFSTSILDPFEKNLASKTLLDELGLPVRVPESHIEQKYLDLAASAQKYLERLVVNILKTYITRLPSSSKKNISMGGGVALNCKLTSVLETEFNDYSFSICPAAGDAGSAVGACYAYLTEYHRASLVTNKTAYLGLNNSALCTRTFLNTIGFKPSSTSPCSPNDFSDLLIEGKVGAIYRGSAEFGPRALGNRSILANPSDPHAISFINTHIKSREDFRPLAPITTIDIQEELFQETTSNQLLQYMLTLIKIPNDVSNLIPSAVHIDGTARLQVITREQNTFLYEVITDFYSRTGIPALINTSLNQRGEPIVNTLQDALECFCSTRLDFICADSFIIKRSDQSKYTISAYTRNSSFPLD